MTARYLVGIDLGTTNTAIAHLDLQESSRIVDDPVLQLVAPGEVATRHTLPSMLYLYGGHELAAPQLRLPWHTPDEKLEAGAHLVGELARVQGALVPGRLVASAKSWLCHPRVDRLAAILPWGESIPGLQKVSPVAASAEYLRHLSRYWRHQMGCELAEQEVVLCVPASFDEVARELSLRAATSIGLQPILLEEPQAAFYAWLASSPEASALKDGDTVLVFDVGGGTTDFSLIAIKGDGADRRYERTAVGDHLLLGGDNMDLLLARKVEGRLGNKLDAHGFLQLVQACRVGKEKLLSDQPKDSWTVHVAGRGLRLIGGAMKDELQRAEVEELILDGFFPKVDADASPQRRGGLQEFGLPYAADAAITKHAAAFLRTHKAKPTAVLWNGGVLRSPKIRDRIVDVLQSWTGDTVKVLDNFSPDLAVARGAAYYALSRRGQGLKITGGAARAYYIGIDTTAVEPGRQTVLCLTPRGFEEGATVELRDHALEIVTNRPVRLRLFSSSDRKGDAAGAMITVKDGELAELPPLYTVLRYARAGQDTALSIFLRAHLSALGTLDLECVARATGNDTDRWRLSFDLRGAESADVVADATVTSDVVAQVVDEDALARAKDLIRTVFGKRATDAGQNPDPASLMKQLQALLGTKDQWSMPVLRALWEPLFELRGGRGKSAQHEARWLNLLGYLLRPGFGYPLDDWRVRETWRLFNAGLVFDKDDSAKLEWWILWRRVSGGLSRTQQEELWKRIGPYFAASFQRRADRKSLGAQETSEMWRAIASMERIAHKHKTELGDVLIGELEKKVKGIDQSLWVLSRLGGRLPLYGPIEEVVPPKRASKWIEKLLLLPGQSEPLMLAIAEIARATGDRARDIDEALRRKVALRLEQASDGARLSKLVLEPTLRQAKEERLAFGDSLPSGIRLAAAPTPAE